MHHVAHQRKILVRLAFSVLVLVTLAAVGVTPTQAQTPPFDRTIIVGGSNTDVVNGNNLLAAVNFAVLSGASSTDPWLVKVEPGIFDLGTQTLNLQSFVDIEGSGRNATFIRSDGNLAAINPSTVNVAAGVNSELRNVTVQYFGQNGAFAGSAIRNASTELKLTLTNIEVEAFGAATGLLSTAGAPRFSAVFPRVASLDGRPATGVSITGGGPIINEMFIFIRNATGGENVGMSITGGATPIVEQVSGVVFGGDLNTGLLVDVSSPRITNNRWTVLDGRASGVRVLATTLTTGRQLVEIKESSIDVEAPRATGVSHEAGGSALLELKDTTVVSRASSGLSAIPVGLINRVSGSRTEVDQTKVDAGQALRNQVSGTTMLVGASKIDGSRSFAAGSTAVCVASYDAAYAPLPPGC